MVNNFLQNPAAAISVWTKRLMHSAKILVCFLFVTAPSSAQTTTEPFYGIIPWVDDVITVGYKDFATIPNIGRRAALTTHLEAEPEGDRVFVNDLQGILYTAQEDGETKVFLDLRDPRWKIIVTFNVIEKGFGAFAIHPQFNSVGSPGYGRFYTLVDSDNTLPAPDFRPEGGDNTHDTLLLEWTMRDPNSEKYDGDAPRELMRIEQPFDNHNAGQIAFNPLATPGSPEFGRLYISIGDGGSAGDPMNMSQNLNSIFGKILRIDPLGSNSKTGQYGIPADNPFVNESETSVLHEIYAYGARSPNRIAWDSKNGQMYVADIGQDVIEEISPVHAGANLGWNIWEGSFKYMGEEGVSLADQRGDPNITYPVVEYSRMDPVFLHTLVAASGLVVYRGSHIPQLQNLLIFADVPNGEIFYVSADNLPDGGQRAIRRILLNDDGTNKTVLQVIRENNEKNGRNTPNRVDLRIASTKDGRVFLLNKRDGIIRLLTK